MIQETEGITLDGVYTGKCLSGIIAHAPKQNPDSTIPFWNTFCVAELVNSVDYKDLPVCFHHYFDK